MTSEKTVCFVHRASHIPTAWYKYPCSLSAVQHPLHDPGMPTPALIREADEGKPDGLKTEHTRTELTNQLLPDLFFLFHFSSTKKLTLYTERQFISEKHVGTEPSQGDAITATPVLSNSSSSHNIFSHSSCTLALMFLKPFALFSLERHFWHLLKLALKSLPSIYCSGSWQFCFACTAYQENKKMAHMRTRRSHLHLTALHLLFPFNSSDQRLRLHPRPR